MWMKCWATGSGGQEPGAAALPSAGFGGHVGAGVGCRGAHLQPGGLGHGVWRPGACASAADGGPVSVTGCQRSMGKAVAPSRSCRGPGAVGAGGGRLHHRAPRHAAPAAARRLPCVLAADGLQALEKLQEERGRRWFCPTSKCRAWTASIWRRNIRADDANLHDLPIIMITSRIAEKHREHAMELGVNHYLGKPYSDEELLSLIQHYARRQREADTIQPDPHQPGRGCSNHHRCAVMAADRLRDGPAGTISRSPCFGPHGWRRCARTCSDGRCCRPPQTPGRLHPHCPLTPSAADVRRWRIPSLRGGSAS